MGESDREPVLVLCVEQVAVLIRAQLAQAELPIASESFLGKPLYPMAGWAKR